MRILVCSSYWPRPDQVHQALFEVDQVRALTDLGHEVHVLVQTPPWRSGASFLAEAALDLDPERVRVQQITMPCLPEPLGRRRLGALTNLRLAGLRMQAWLARQKRSHGEAEAIVVHGERNIGMSAGIWNPGRKRPAVMIVHGADPAMETLPEDLLKPNMGACANEGLHRVILVGNRLRSYAVRLGYDPARLIVIPNGFRAPPPPIALPRDSQKPVRIITVARLVAVKGIDDALHALAKILSNHPALEWTFDILGDGPERTSLEELRERLGLQDRVRFHGAVPHSKVLRQLEQSAIFVLPSWNEAFGLAYLEAMAMGTAVIGCKENGAADILQDGVDGRLVPPRDVDALACTIAELVANASARDTLAQAAIQSVRRFSWTANATAVLEAIDGV